MITPTKAAESGSGLHAAAIGARLAITKEREAERQFDDGWARHAAPTPRRIPRAAPARRA